MIYPGTSPMVGSNDPNSLDQRKQQLMKQLTAGTGIRNNLSFGGSIGDAPGRSPSLSFNPFFAAIQHMLGSNNAGQANNQAVSGHPFFGNGFSSQNMGGNAPQAAAVTTGQAAGSAGIGGVAGTPAAAPAGNPGVGAPGGVSINPTALAQMSNPAGASMQWFGLGGGSAAPNPNALLQTLGAPRPAPLFGNVMGY